MILRRLSEDTGLEIGYLYKLSRSASHRYNTYEIAKRLGGVREIHHPSPEIKFIQRWLNDSIFSYLSIHECATAYRDGVSIADNARKHLKSRYLLKLDFQEFFPSITSADVVRALKLNAPNLPFPLSNNDFRHITNMVCRFELLTIGAPSSPILSNAVMEPFDQYWHQLSRNSISTYSRYADDICISSKNEEVLNNLYSHMRVYLRSLKFPKLRLNEGKCYIASKKRRRTVTGLVLTPDNKISIGRSRKRWIKGQVYKYLKGELSDNEISYLKGYLAYVESVEPKFIKSIQQKYRKKYKVNSVYRVSKEELHMRKDVY